MNKLGILEGLLYVQGDEGLSFDLMMEVLEVNKEEAEDLIRTLKKRYEEDSYGLRIHYLGNTFKLTTKEEHAPFYSKLLTNPSSSTLSMPALETLAIIAYNEPITRLKIDELRGVDSVYILRKLLAKGFIKECGKADIPGRPILYKTTDSFLDYFGLSTKEDLPNMEEFLSKEESIEENEVDLFRSKYTEEKEER